MNDDDGDEMTTATTVTVINVAAHLMGWYKDRMFMDRVIEWECGEAFDLGLPKVRRPNTDVVGTRITL